MMSQLEQIYFISQIVAALAVIISILYLAIQIKHTRKQNKKEANNLLAKQRGDFVNDVAYNKEFSYIVAKGLAGKERLSANEYFRFTNHLYYVFVHLELAHKKWLDKDIDADTWKAWDEGSNDYFKCPGIHAWWRQVVGFTPNFRAYVDACIEKYQNSEIEVPENVIEFLAEAGKYPDLTNNKMEENI